MQFVTYIEQSSYSLVFDSKKIVCELSVDFSSLEQRQLSERRNYWKVLFTLQFPWDSVETSATTFVIYHNGMWTEEGCTLEARASFPTAIINY